MYKTLVLPSEERGKELTGDTVNLRQYGALRSSPANRGSISMSSSEDSLHLRDSVNQIIPYQGKPACTVPYHMSLDRANVDVVRISLGVTAGFW
jgi:hypothetical protein